MWPFNRSSGCSHHHWTEWKKRHGKRYARLDEEYRDGQILIVVHYRYRRTCQHDGCYAEQREWQQGKTFPKDELQLGDAE